MTPKLWNILGKLHEIRFFFTYFFSSLFELVFCCNTDLSMVSYLHCPLALSLKCLALYRPGLFLELLLCNSEFWIHVYDCTCWQLIETACLFHLYKREKILCLSLNILFSKKSEWWDTATKAQPQRQWMSWKCVLLYEYKNTKIKYQFQVNKQYGTIALNSTII